MSTFEAPSIVTADEGCIPCKLHGACPLPTFADLKRCLGGASTAIQPSKSVSPRADADGWVTTCCGRIRAPASAKE